MLDTSPPHWSGLNLIGLKRNNFGHTGESKNGTLTSERPLMPRLRVSIFDPRDRLTGIRTVIVPTAHRDKLRQQDVSSRRYGTRRPFLIHLGYRHFISTSTMCLRLTQALIKV